jgi:predicted KAP-like P-loop ATPase
LQKDYLNVDTSRPLLTKSARALLLRIFSKTEETPGGLIGPSMHDLRSKYDKERRLLDALEEQGFIERRDDRYRVKLKGLSVLRHPGTDHVLDYCSKFFQAFRARYKSQPNTPIPIREVALQYGLDTNKTAAVVTYLRDASIWGGHSNLAEPAPIAQLSEGVLDFDTFDEMINRIWQRQENADDLIYRAIPKRKPNYFLNNTPSFSTDNASSSVVSLISADRPITSSAEDRLQRSAFAENLARVIHQWQASDSLVIALYGVWGSGKTSIKNLILQNLSLEVSQPEIVDFNPWQWSGHEQLAAAFFDEINKRLGRQNRNAQAKRLAKSLQVYSAFLAANTRVVADVPKFVFCILLLFGLAGFGFPLLTDVSALTGFFGVMCAAIVTVVAILGLSEKVVSAVSKWLELRSELYNKTLSELKSDVAAELAKLDRPFLVVIDDMDRLTQDEIRSVIQLVKANADFPNFIYLLPFQRSTIAFALRQVADGDGEDFLEKIIQVGFNVPDAGREDIDRMLWEKLNVLFSTEITKQHFDQGRWIHLYHDGLWRYFANLRDVNRFVASLAFYTELTKTDGIMDVNPVDLVAIEALRLFEPDFYNWLGNSNDVMTSASRAGSEEQKHISGEIMEAVTRVSERNRQNVKEIVRHLFPNRDWVFGGSRYASDFYEGWRKELRVCCQDIFDRYFQLRLHQDDVSQADVQRLIEMTTDPRRFVSALVAYAARNQLSNALKAFGYKIDDVNVAHTRSIITALFDFGESLDEEEPGFAIGPEWKLLRVVKDILLREPDIERRAQTLSDAIEQAQWLSMATRFVSLQSQDNSESLFSKSELKSLQRLCSQQISLAASDGSLREHRDLSYILYRWSDWESESTVRRWVNDLINDNEGLLILLRAFTQHSASHTSGDWNVRITWFIRLKDIEKFADLARIEQRVSTLHKPAHTDKDAVAIAAFKEALGRRKQGKSDEDCLET